MRAERSHDWFKGSQKDVSAEDEDALVTFVHAIQEVPELRQKVLLMLLLEPAPRRRVIEGSMLKLERARGPDMLIRALSCLKDDGVAAKARELIIELHTTSHPRSTGRSIRIMSLSHLNN